MVLLALAIQEKNSKIAYESAQDGRIERIIAFVRQHMKEQCMEL